MSGNDEAVFTRCKTIEALQRAIDVTLAAETWPAKARIDVADVQLSATGWAMLTPVELDFFLQSGDLDELRLARFARALGAPVYEISVRSTVSVTLFEASSDGKVRVSGAPLWPRVAKRFAELKIPHKEALAFGLLPVTDTIHARVKQLADSPQVADYLGTLAGFGGWRRQGGEGESLVFSARAGAPLRREPSVASSPVAKPAPRGTRPAPAPARPAPKSTGRTTRKPPSSARGGRSR